MNEHIPRFKRQGFHEENVKSVYFNIIVVNSLLEYIHDDTEKFLFAISCTDKNSIAHFYLRKEVPFLNVKVSFKCNTLS